MASKIAQREPDKTHGEGHPKACLTDVEVEQLREWYDSGLLGYKKLVVWCFHNFHKVASVRSVRDIVQYRRR